MSEPHAAIALAQLRRLDEFIAHRQRVAARYDAACVDAAGSTLHVPDDGAATTTSTSPSFPTEWTGPSSRSAARGVRGRPVG